MNDIFLMGGGLLSVLVCLFAPILAIYFVVVTVRSMKRQEQLLEDIRDALKDSKGKGEKNE